jgi:membrane-bound lytic murein transglycosylase D
MNRAIDPRQNRIFLRGLASIFALFAVLSLGVPANAIPLTSKSPAAKPSTGMSNNSGVTFTPVDTSPYFDIPVTYNNKVRWWINHFQTGGRKWFRTWLERSTAYLPLMQKQLAASGLPQDLAYVAMIESGFSPHATSQAEAVGYWQFITPTANRYGLTTNWWLDERRDFTKSTKAASKYLGDLFRQFGSWYLTAAAYNMGEGRMGRLVNRYGTRNYWILSKKSEFPEETRQYIPKMLAAMLIAKAPKLYGFHELNSKAAYVYDYYHVPGGTDLSSLADFLKVNPVELSRLNPELVRGYVPGHVHTHPIRIPKGSSDRVADFIRARL